MKLLQFNFCHPVKGFATLFSTDKKSATKRVDIDSMESNSVEIPVEDCASGKWKAVLNWEYNDELFTIQKDFEIDRDLNYKILYRK